MTVRDARIEDIEPLARLWFDSWHDAHDELVPGVVVAARTVGSFEGRLRDWLDDVRVAGPVNRPSGLCIVDGTELNQLFVAREARGTGVAGELESDAQRRFRSTGVDVAWLACAIGNQRAARFYQRCGWVRSGIVTCELKAAAESVPIEAWRYEKVVASG